MVCIAQGTPRPTRISNTLLPMVFDTAMSPKPATKDQVLKNFKNLKLFLYTLRSNKILYFQLFCCCVPSDIHRGHNLIQRGSSDASPHCSIYKQLCTIFSCSCDLEYFVHPNLRHSLPCKRRRQTHLWKYAALDLLNPKKHKSFWIQVCLFTSIYSSCWLRLHVNRSECINEGQKNILRIKWGCLLRDPSIQVCFSANSQSCNVKTLQRERCTLSSHNETSYAVWDTGASSQESDAHNDIRDSQSVADYSHLKGYEECQSSRIAQRLF